MPVRRLPIPHCRFLVPAVATTLLTGCGGGGYETRAGEELVDYAEVQEQGGAAGAPSSRVPPPPPTQNTRVQTGVAPGMQQGGGPAEPATAPVAHAQVPSMIIRTGRAAVEVDSMERAVAQVQAMAQRVGGYVANTRIQAGEHEVRLAELELKIPSARWEEAVSGLRPLGEVRSLTENAQEVGEEFVDLSARVANARRLEERLVTLLATRTGKLEDVLAVERELARVREEIERHEGRLRYLRTRVAMSTLTVVVAEPGPVLGDRPGADPIAEAFRDAWRNFVGFVAGFIASLGVLIPLGLLTLAFALFVRWLRRRFPRDRASRPVPSARTTTEEASPTTPPVDPAP